MLKAGQSEKWSEIETEAKAKAVINIHEYNCLININAMWNIYNNNNNDHGDGNGNDD